MTATAALPEATRWDGAACQNPYARISFIDVAEAAIEMSTVLSPVQKGRRWRVQITQPDGSVHYFGRFASEKRALEWIATHAWLINQPTKSSDSSPPILVFRDSNFAKILRGRLKN